MKILAVYDKPECADRYTIILDDTQRGKFHTCLSVDDRPSHPQGFSQFGECIWGDHLGKQIEFSDLPEEVQKHVMWRIEE